MSERKHTKGAKEQGHCTFVLKAYHLLMHQKKQSRGQVHTGETVKHTHVTQSKGLIDMLISAQKKGLDLKDANCLSTHSEWNHQPTFLLVSTAAAYRFFSRAMRAAVASASSLFCFSMRSLMSASDLSWAAVAWALYSVCVCVRVCVTLYM